MNYTKEIVIEWRRNWIVWRAKAQCVLGS